MVKIQATRTNAVSSWGLVISDGTANDATPAADDGFGVDVAGLFTILLPVLFGVDEGTTFNGFAAVEDAIVDE